MEPFIIACAEADAPYALWFWVIGGVLGAIVGYAWHLSSRRHPFYRGPVEALVIGFILCLSFGLMPVVLHYLAYYEASAWLLFGSDDVTVFLDVAALACCVATYAVILTFLVAPEARPAAVLVLVVAWGMAVLPIVAGSFWPAGGMFIGVILAGVLTFVAVCALFEEVRDVVEDWWYTHVRVQSGIATAPGARHELVVEKPVREQAWGNLHPRGWLGIVRVDQGPALLDPNVVTADKGGKPPEKSWLRAILPQSVFPDAIGVEVAYDGNAFQVGFFARARSKVRAQRKADTIKRFLQEFPGLDCTAEVRPLSSALVHQGTRLHELRLPRPPYPRLPALELLGRLATDLRAPVRVYVTFQGDSVIFHAGDRFRDLMHRAVAGRFGTMLPKEGLDRAKQDADQLISIWGYDNLDPVCKVCVYVGAELRTAGEVAEFRNGLEGVRAQLVNLRGQAAALRPASGKAWQRVVTLARVTGRFTTAKAVDFGFPASITIRRGARFALERVQPIPGLTLDSRDYVVFGSRVDHGRRTAQFMGVSITDLATGLVALGLPGKGKTFFIASVLAQVHRKQPTVGILTANFAKEGQDRLYPHDPECIFAADAPGFEMPFMPTPGAARAKKEKYFEEAAEFIANALGVTPDGWDLPQKKIYEVLCDREPQDMQTLLEMLLAKLEETGFAKDEHANVVASVKERVMTFLHDEHLLRAAHLLPPGRAPRMVEAVLAGEAVYADFSGVRPEAQRFYMFCLLHHVMAFAPQVPPEVGRALRIVLVCDEGHCIMGRAVEGDKSPLAHNTLSIQKLFHRVLAECRSRGVGLIIADQNARNIIPEAVNLPAVQVLFCSGDDSMQELSLEPEEKAVVRTLVPRRALVKDRASSQEYVMETVPYNLPPGENLPSTDATSIDLGALEASILADPLMVVPEVLPEDVQGLLRRRAIALARAGNPDAAEGLLLCLWITALHALLGPDRAPPGNPTLMGLLRSAFAAAQSAQSLQDARPQIVERAQVLAGLTSRFQEGVVRPEDPDLLDSTLDFLVRVVRQVLAQPALAVSNDRVIERGGTFFKGDEQRESGAGNESASADEYDELPLPREEEMANNIQLWCPEVIEREGISRFVTRFTALVALHRGRDAYGVSYVMWNYLFRQSVGARKFSHGESLSVICHALLLENHPSGLGSLEDVVTEKILALRDAEQEFATGALQNGVGASARVAVGAHQSCLDLFDLLKSDALPSSLVLSP